MGARQMAFLFRSVFVLMSVAAVGCKKEDMCPADQDAWPGYQPGEEYSGGEGTTFDPGSNAFNHPATNLTNEEDGFFVVGNSFFTQNWVIAPASTAGRDGLGPLFNAQSCGSCHLRDGRGSPPEVDNEVSGLLVRLSVPGVDAHGAPLPHPIYGGQMQPFGIPGVQAEAGLSISCQSVEGSFQDGTPYTLQVPTYTLTGNYGGIEDALTSPRVAQQLCGMGLLEAIPEAELLANATCSIDGISGRVNRVWNAITSTQSVGRFGWKANQPNVRQQTAGAFNGDLGITSSIFPQDQCTASQPTCSTQPNGNGNGENFELEDHTLDRVAFYTATLGVPARRNVQDAQVLAGKALFNSTGCAACHRPQYTTGTSAISPALSGQTIYPYTDLLLHDMGPALADGRSDFLADGQEWRTPPLWGIGLFKTTNGHTRYLHDGRARNLNEAILWHGGEALPAQQRYLGLSATERNALLTFLNSL
jgi:CxxC motif-containing protein (DUF1111 family)